MSFSYSDHERLAALERRIQDLEAQVQLLHDLVGQRTGLSSAGQHAGQHASSGASYDVVLTQYSLNSKISVIKVIRELTGLGLKEAKELSESTPCVLLQDVSWQRGEEMRRSFEEVGAVIELRPR